MLAAQRPTAEVEQRDDHEPDREVAHVAADEADRAEEGKQRRDDAEEDLPEVEAADAEDLLRERARSRGDDDQLEDRPAEALQDVQRPRQVRAPIAERRTQ